jgi:hypothetical protein
MGASNLGKAYELWLLYRAEVMAYRHEMQAVGTHGIDARLLAPYTILEPVAERAAEERTTAILVEDMETAFPARDARRSTLALHAAKELGGGGYSRPGTRCRLRSKCESQ